MADIYTCIGPDGTTASQDRPCAGAQQQTRHQVTAAEAKQPAAHTGYASCEEMQFNIDVREGGLSLLAEEMVTFGWSKDDLRAEVVRCNLPSFAAD